MHALFLASKVAALGEVDYSRGVVDGGVRDFAPAHRLDPMSLLRALEASMPERSFELLRQLLDTETIDLCNSVEQIRRAACLALDYAACWHGITRIEGRPASLMNREEFRETWPDAAWCVKARPAPSRGRSRVSSLTIISSRSQYSFRH